MEYATQKNTSGFEMLYSGQPIEATDSVRHH
jgi:hypothetical protein